MIIHQSDITAWARCPQAMFLMRTGKRQTQTSALAYGTVMHYAIEVFEREYRTGTPWIIAKQTAVETFRHYWHPLNIAAITTPVEHWLPHQSYASLARNGVDGITWYADTVRDTDEELLATEFAFQVPIEGTWDYDLDEPHVLVGTIDRLKVTAYRGKPVVGVDDLKTGKDYPYLRQNLQFSAYCYATTRKEFWTGWRGEDGFGARGLELYARFTGLPRRATWISLKSRKFMDAGWRGHDDYARFALAAEQVISSMKADIYPLSISGENCNYCTVRDMCGGIGVPSSAHGAPQ